MTTKSLLLHYARMWKEKYGTAYTISWSRETSHASRLIKERGADASLDILNYYLFHLADSYIADKRHPFTLVASRINECAAGIEERRRKEAAGSQAHEDLKQIQEAREKLK